MPLHLVGETIDKARSHYLAETGRLVQLMRGIYVDAQDDIDQTVLSHAVRIARYLYPRAYLSAASAVLLCPTPGGRLYLTGQRVQRRRIRALEVIQNKAPVRPSVASAIVADSLGEFGVSVSAVRQRFLEAFRLRSEHAASIDAGMRETIAARLIEEYGDPTAASDALWALEAEVPDARGCCFGCGGDGHWASACPRSPAPPFWASAVAAAAARIAPPAPVTVASVSADDPAGLRRCYKCGSAGHWAGACGANSPGQVWAPSQQLCTRCGRASHPTADCTAVQHLEGWALPPRQRAAARSDGCARCGQPDHAAARCMAVLDWASRPNL